MKIYWWGSDRASFPRIAGMKIAQWQCKTLAHTNLTPVTASIIHSFVNNISFREGKLKFRETFMINMCQNGAGFYTFFGSYNIYIHSHCA